MRGFLFATRRYNELPDLHYADQLFTVTPAPEPLCAAVAINHRVAVWLRLFLYLLKCVEKPRLNSANQSSTLALQE